MVAIFYSILRVVDVRLSLSVIEDVTRVTLEHKTIKVALSADFLTIEQLELDEPANNARKIASSLTCVTSHRYRASSIPRTEN